MNDKKQIMQEAAIANIKALDVLIGEIASKVKEAKKEALIDNKKSPFEPLCSSSSTMRDLNKDLETAKSIYENYEKVLHEGVMSK